MQGPAPATLLGLLLVAAITAAAAASLAFDYRYPKQDFEGAMRLVDARREGGEPVVTAGGAVYPFLEYYKRDWPGIRSAAELRDVRAGGRRVWMIYTLAEYIEADAPDLIRMLRDDCRVAEVFRGTVAGGDVTVCALDPVTMNAAQSPVR